MDTAIPVPAPPASPPPRRRPPGAGTLLTLVNAVLAGIGGVYASTQSVLITIIAGVMAIVITALTLVFHQ